MEVDQNGNRRSSEEVTRVQVEWVAPEGGWGYMVCLGFALVFSLIMLLMPSFGLIYNDFLDDRGQGTSGTTMVNGVFSAVVSCAGFLTTSALKRFTLRSVGIFGAIFYVGGSLVGIFISSVMELVIAIGLIQGIGFGIMIPISLTCFNNYFLVRRAAMMSLSSVIVGCLGMLFPMLIKICMEEYGFRGTLAIIAALNLHAVFAMVVMHPIEWHAVPKKKAVREGNEADRDIYCDIVKNKPLAEKLHDLQKIDECQNDDENTECSDAKDPFLKQTAVQILSKSTCSLSSVQGERIFSPKRCAARRSHEDIRDIDYCTKMIKASSLISLGNWTSNVLASETVQTQGGKWQTLVDFLDLTLLKDLVYSNICFGITFAFFSDITFFMLEPHLLHSYGFTRSEIALCVTAGAASDLVSRAIFAIIHFYVTVNSRLVFFGGNCFIVILRIVFLQFHDFFPVLLLTAGMGFFRSWIHVPLPLVIADHFTKEKFPSAYGLFMMLSGVIMLFLAPLVDIVTDMTGSAVAGFHSLTVCSLLCVIPWAAEMIYFKCKTKTIK